MIFITIIYYAAIESYIYLNFIINEIYYNCELYKIEFYYTSSNKIFYIYYA